MMDLTNCMMNKDDEIKQLEAQVSRLAGQLNDMTKKCDDALLLAENNSKAYLALKSQSDKLPENTSCFSDLVEQIYAEYPKKIDPKKSKVSIGKALTDHLKDGGTPETLLDTVKEFSQEVKRFVPNKSHKNWGKVPHSCTFFNQERHKLTAEDWTSQLRDASYVKPERKKKLPDEPPHWRDVLKALYPDCDPNRHEWEVFFTGHPDLVQELRDNYRRVLRELNL